jgi:hypothetical protein
MRFEFEFDAKITKYDDRRGFSVEKRTLTARRVRMVLEFGERGSFLVGRSIVNPTMTRRQVFDLLMKSIADKKDSEPINPMIAENIVKEFGRYYPSNLSASSSAPSKNKFNDEKGGSND